VKVASFNINNINKRLDNRLAWLAKAEPDVVCLQELKAEQGAFPVNALRTLGYEAVWQGERSWNGVAILARHQVPVLTCTSLPGNPDGIFARGWRHPFDRLRASSERSRSSGGAKDLPFRHFVPREIPRPAGKKRGLFGMTPGNSDSPNHEDHQARYIRRFREF